MHTTEWIGRVLDGRYRIERVLGEGGMGAVFAAEQIALQKPVALKIILPELAGDPELAQRFAREAMVSARLDHPHVASALDYGALEGGGAYLVMQLARGRGLRSWMRERGGDWRFALSIGAQIADALAAAHAAGIVHRDLKPENVIVEDRDGALHARVLDFGIARVADAPKDTGPLTRVGTVMGTPGYMAPEQALGEAVDARADVYALGVMLWELAAGQALFDHEELGAIVSAQLTSSAPALASEVKEVPPELDALVARMLAGSKTSRPSHGAEVRDALRAIGASVGLAVGPAGSGVLDPAALGARSSGMIASAASAHARTELAQSSQIGTSAAIAAHAPTAFASEAVPSFVSPSATVSPHAPTTIVAPPSKTLAWLIGGAGAGVLALVVLSCVVTRIACSGDPSEVASAPPTVPSPAPSTPQVATGSASPAYGLAPIPPDLAQDLAVLETHPDASLRSAAAARLAPRAAELPSYARAVLAYETGAECDDRREAVLAMRAFGDPRAIPALHRIAATPPTGCGRRGNQDCDRCLRRDLERTLERLSGE
ncbi:serine/threonine-protein kinase [Sandaracinus amylolyticus]|nr:serine/threonine-protein kinase [Sandaracinus amylolyticus]